VKKKITIGRKDKVDFPELGLKDIPVKVDTGAYTSAIHCRNIVIKTVDGKDVLYFTLLDPSHSQYDNIEYSSINFVERLKILLVLQRRGLLLKPISRFSVRSMLSNYP